MEIIWRLGIVGCYSNFGAFGVTMLVLMIIAYILAQPWFRRNKLRLPKPLKKLIGFNAFWYSHHLFDASA
uniref:Uncharacterized protein n=1 Tax=Nelumbo nucifera TaxID=4432 RepID=A0A822Y8M8_NELNU|nr:TPA_asm: hypothetical protein HUJ06_028863 [Nelumbo nucifera]